MSRNKAEVAQFVIDAWNAHDAEKAFSLFTDDASDDDTTQPAKHSGPDCQKYWADLFVAFPDVSFELSNIISSDHYAVIECTFNGTQKSAFPAWAGDVVSGKRFEVRGAFVLRFRGDEVYEITEYYNLGAIEKQLLG